MTRSPWMPLLLAALVSLLVGIGVAMEPYFAGDVRLTRAVQAASPHPEWWARPISQLAPAPGKYSVIAIALVASFFLAGWRGLAITAAFLLVEQYGAEYTKAWFKRPRPSRELITVIGTGGGYSFPSTTMTFFSVTFGAIGVLAAVHRKAPYRIPVMVLGFGMLVLGGAARVALGLHWPSDVALTVLLCVTWIWAAARVVLGKG
jgi:membrane-associated phospholipid phosphatase